MRYLSMVMLLPLLGLAAWAQSGGTPETPAASRGSLQETEWTLVELDGAPVQAGSDRTAPTLQLSTADQRASGFAGCNRMTGGYESTGEALRFGAVVTTRMHCEATMELEQRYLAAIEATRRYRLAGGMLELIDGDGKLVARFRTS